MIAGIDYGSKLAGTTVIAYIEAQADICLVQSEKKADADAMILDWIKKTRPRSIFIDAPLSLPGIYSSLPDCKDYFYRKADRELKGMSPMFLGGLTARAMQLKDQMQKLGVQVKEVYPGGLARQLDFPSDQYKKEKTHIPTIAQKILTLLPPATAPDLNNWHQVDALLALLSGYRFQKGAHLICGDPFEGEIII